MKISSKLKEFFKNSDSKNSPPEGVALQLESSLNLSTIFDDDFLKNDTSIPPVYDSTASTEKLPNASRHGRTKQRNLLSNNKSSVTKAGTARKETERRPEKIIIWNKPSNYCVQTFEEESTQGSLTLSPAYRDDGENWDVSKKVISSPSFNVGTVNVKAEEIGLVLVILLLWAGAITLFINRWGKLRMLEPYQPQYTAPVASPPPRQQLANPPFININIQSTSSLSLNDNYRLSSPLGAMGGYNEWDMTPREMAGHLSPRRSIGGTQSMHYGGDHSPSSLNLYTLNPQRRVRSAVDLVSLVMQEKLTNGQQQHQIPQFAATNV